METLEYVYENLKQLGLTSSQKSFSQNWLSRSPHYYSMLRSSGLPASTAVIVNLSCKLKERHAYYQNNKYGELREVAPLIYGKEYDVTILSAAIKLVGDNA